MFSNSNYLWIENQSCLHLKLTMTFIFSYVGVSDFQTIAVGIRVSSFLGNETEWGDFKYLKKIFVFAISEGNHQSCQEVGNAFRENYGY